MPDVPRKFPLSTPLSKLKDTAFDAVKDPKGTSERLIGQARGAAGVGRQLAEGLASQVVGQVSARTRGRRAADAPRAASPTQTHAVPSPTPRQAQGDPVVPHPATSAPSAEPVPTTEARVTARKATPADVAKKAPARKSAAKKSTATKAPARKTPATKAPAKKAAAKKASATKAPARKAAPTTDGPGDKLPPRAAPGPTPPPALTEVEPNPEATTPR